MPDQFGNPTPREVFDSMNAEKDAMVSRGIASGNPDTQRNSVLFAMGRLAMSGQDPRLVRAQGIQKVFQDVQKLDQGEQEGELEYQLRLANEASTRMRNVDPTTTSALLKQTRELEREIQVRDQLKQQHEQGAEALIRSKRENKQEQTLADQFDNVAYAFDMNAGKEIEQVLIDDPKYDEKVARIMQANPGAAMLTRPEYIKAAGKDAQGSGRVLPIGTVPKLIEELDSNFKLATTVEQLNDVVMGAYAASGQNVLSDTSSIEKFVNGKVGAVHEGMNWFRMKTGETVTNYVRTGAGKELLDRARARGISDSLITGIAYMLAQARNDRVTDADLEAAFNMIGGDSGDINVVMSALDSQLENITLTRKTIEDWMSEPEAFEPPAYRLLQRKFQTSQDAINRTRAVRTKTNEKVGIGAVPSMSDQGGGGVNTPRGVFE